jgi:hypothetical protein
MVVNQQDPDPAFLLLESGFAGHVRSTCSMASQPDRLPAAPQAFLAAYRES